MTDALGTERLNELVRPATVRVTGGDGRFWGSGFLVAPGWVLTAAHVVRAGLGSQEAVRDPFAVVLDDGFGAQQQVPARLGYWPRGVFEARALSLELDIALVQLQPPYGGWEAAEEAAGEWEHECVWLSDRVGEPAARLKAYGWYVAGGSPAEWDATFEYGGRDGSWGLRFGPESEVPPGASGGPVVDLDSRAVIGLVKRNSTTGTGDIKEGGLAVRTALLRTLRNAERVCPGEPLGQDPYEGLLALHDQRHAAALRGPGWHRVQLDAPEYGMPDGPPDPARWSPSDRMRFFGLLGALPAPRGTSELVQLVRAALHDPRVRLPDGVHTLRDGHGHLYRDGYSYPAYPFLQYAKLAALLGEHRSPHSADALLAWLESRVEQLSVDREAQFRELRLPESLVRPRQPAPGGVPVQRNREAEPEPGLLRHTGTRPGDGPTVVLELEQALWSSGPAYCAYVRVEDGDEPATYRDLLEPEGGIPEDRLVDALREPLRGLFAELDTEERKVPLEVALPVDSFGLDVPFWMLHRTASSFSGDDPAYFPLGVQRQVVLRSLDRRPETPGEPDGQWERRWRELLDSGLSVLPTPPYGHLLREEYLADAAPGSVPALCHPPADEYGHGALALALRHGHGVAVWDAEAHDSGGCGARCRRLHRELAETVGSVGSVRELPERIRVLRARVKRGEESAQWAAKLAILYDDATRPLPAVAGTLDSP